MSSINKSQFYDVFKNTELCDYLISKNISSDELRNFMEKIILNVLVEQINKKQLVSEGKKKCITNYSTMKKSQLIEHLWNRTQPSDNTNLKRIKTCTQNKNKQTEPILPMK